MNNNFLPYQIKKNAQQNSTMANEIGTLSNLTTSDKSSLVNAINSNVSSLAQSTSQVTNLQNTLGQQTKLKSVDIPVNLGYATTDLQNAISRAQSVNGANMVILSVGYLQNASDNTMTANSNNSRLGTIIDYCNTLGLTVAVKIHINRNDTGTSAITPSDIPTWFSNWQTACLSVAATCSSKGVKYLGIANEMYTMTNGNTSNWQSLINAIKAQYPTLNLFLCVNKSEYATCIIYSMFDVIGFNFYPAMTINGTSETDTIMRAAFHNDLDGYNLISMVRSLKQTYKKPVWITEIGCTSYIGALKETSLYSGLTTYDEATQKFYYQYMFDTVWNLSSIDAMSIWSIGDSQSAVSGLNTTFTYQYKQAESIVNQYWKGV